MMDSERPGDPGGDEKPKQRFSLARFAAIYQFAGELTIFGVLGVFLDYRYGWTPWGTIGVGMIGLGFALYHLIMTVTRP